MAAAEYHTVWNEVSFLTWPTLSLCSQPREIVITCIPLGRAPACINTVPTILICDSSFLDVIDEL